ncbi:Keratin, type I cytoskeletal 47 kDa [Oryzias melastigma]|uniref:Keratin, type I cytoskeletal 47 kDa n=1 Tax=Oryzias melastigma TaxID=30732 RepID=A0A834C8J9_ORYME|nr:Keratin, type I cytoskeletal 47 kDa [Oryzias melastigma]
MQKNAVEMQLSEVEVRYSDQLRQLQCRVDSLQEELNRLRTETTQQSMEFQRLLDIKTRLEMEIAEYRRLLGGYEEQTVTVKEVKIAKKEEEKHKPVVSQRTVVVIEELVDGKEGGVDDDLRVVVSGKHPKKDQPQVPAAMSGSRRPPEPPRPRNTT